MNGVIIKSLVLQLPSRKWFLLVPRYISWILIYESYCLIRVSVNDTLVNLPSVWGLWIQVTVDTMLRSSFIVWRSCHQYLNWKSNIIGYSSQLNCGILVSTVRDNCDNHIMFVLTKVIKFSTQLLFKQHFFISNISLFWTIRLLLHLSIILLWWQFLINLYK